MTEEHREEMNGNGDEKPIKGEAKRRKGEAQPRRGEAKSGSGIAQTIMAKALHRPAKE